MVSNSNSTLTRPARAKHPPGQVKLKYIASFDGLRGIAVMLLMLVHGSYGYYSGGIPRVDLFYIMSGFLITYLLFYEFLSSGNISFEKFYARRALRIVPALVACVILSNILWSSSHLMPGQNRLIATLSSLFFFNNLVVDPVRGNMSHLWSLSVEEHFYLIWPVVTLFFLFKLSDRNRIIFLSALLVCIEIFRIIAYLHMDQWRGEIFWIDPYGFTFCRIDCILIGALLFFVLYREKYKYGAMTRNFYDNLLLIGLALVSILSALTFKLLDPRWLGGGFILTNILCALTVVIAIRNPEHPVLANKVLLWIGRRSYGIYLYHMPIFFYMERFREADNFTNFVIVTFFRFAISIVVAAISYEYIERPFLAYKGKYK